MTQLAQHETRPDSSEPKVVHCHVCGYERACWQLLHSQLHAVGEQELLIALDSSLEITLLPALHADLTKEDGQEETSMVDGQVQPAKGIMIWGYDSGRNHHALMRKDVAVFSPRT